MKQPKPFDQYNNIDRVAFFVGLIAAVGSIMLISLIWLILA